jgi:hypothetical protein
MLVAGCGLRLGEAIALRWADVDLERRRMRVTATMYQDGRTEPKSARSRRTVAMPIFVTQYLRTHKVAQNERRLRSVAWAEADYVFDRGGGVPMLLLSVSHRFSKCADAIGLGDVRFHDLRHAYATRLARAWGASEGRQRGAGPLLDRDHHGHLQPRHAEHVAGGGRRHRRGTRRVMVATWRQRSASGRAAGGVSAARLHSALVAQWREQRFPKPRVAGSIPAGGTTSWARPTTQGDTHPVRGREELWT